jgi:hypothetical protein
MSTVNRWFTAAGFTEVVVKHGPNGIVGKGKKSSPVCMLRG